MATVTIYSYILNGLLVAYIDVSIHRILVVSKLGNDTFCI